MGRPSKVQPARPGSSRRDFFKRSSAGAAALVAADVACCEKFV
ncbi:twin-arginine translocation signal domain-containing protein [Klebsiella pneumoniae]|uniref:Twin-arginine translocation signal domain-containing protein n=1 Tax=Klebsiella pneumoniae TaxID=573 RepID=A0AAW8AQ84_KLEPN|nr:twin-arginine translocation signal domain-containing protein [Klebsiella pneumoniae]MDP0971394.1 twin-arginine translocation signal domain-containing protein [Klebsiella pneumoniae]